jgi:phosphoribosylaminoimidazolecarboxamide formyltransferase/IMP cyclohydrolase
MRALLSVSDKTGVIDFARGLGELEIEIFSTGGTKQALEGVGLTVHSVEELTAFPEILDGRVKTLHPAVHGGILARRSLPHHMEQLAKTGIQTIDLVAVNLYPFIQTIAKEDVTLEEALENIDIGGPTLIRAAAKNFPDVIVVVDPQDYGMVIDQLHKGGIDWESRHKLAHKAFQHVAIYDTAIAQYLQDEIFPEEMTIALGKHSNLSYGENPHQQAAFYIEQGRPLTLSLASAIRLSGKEPSFNNILDLDAALNVVADFSDPTVVIIKHNTPCGLASHESLAEAYRRALAGDPVAAFGGIIGSNRPIDLACAEEISKSHYDAIIAPQYDPQALKLLGRKRGMRILLLSSISLLTPSYDFRRVNGGFLVQTRDFITEGELKPRPVTRRQPTAREMDDLLFAWRAVRHVKSNAILIAKERALLGVGAGQTSRVASVELALKGAAERAQDSVLASDAFFPFTDGVELAAKGGVRAIIQPGGSIRDKKIIEVANQYNIAMVFTGVRHFRH